jgi:hypothetical protein
MHVKAETCQKDTGNMLMHICAQWMLRAGITCSAGSGMHDGSSSTASSLLQQHNYTRGAAAVASSMRGMQRQRLRQIRSSGCWHGSGRSGWLC